MIMKLLTRISQIFKRSSTSGGSDGGERLGKAAERLSKVRGDKVTAMPADPGDNPSANVAAAAKDYGLSRFSGESDAMGQASGSYRAAKKRRDRKGY